MPTLPMSFSRISNALLDAIDSDMRIIERGCTNISVMLDGIADEVADLRKQLDSLKRAGGVSHATAAQQKQG